MNTAEVTKEEVKIGDEFFDFAEKTMDFAIVKEILNIGVSIAVTAWKGREVCNIIILPKNVFGKKFDQKDLAQKKITHIDLTPTLDGMVLMSFPAAWYIDKESAHREWEENVKATTDISQNRSHSKEVPLITSDISELTDAERLIVEEFLRHVASRPEFPRRWDDATRDSNAAYISLAEWNFEHVVKPILQQQ